MSITLYSSKFGYRSYSELYLYKALDNIQLTVYLYKALNNIQFTVLSIKHKLMLLYRGYNVYTVRNNHNTLVTTCVA